MPGEGGEVVNVATHAGNGVGKIWLYAGNPACIPHYSRCAVKMCWVMRTISREVARS